MSNPVSPDDSSPCEQRQLKMPTATSTEMPDIQSGLQESTEKNLKCPMEEDPVSKPDDESDSDWTIGCFQKKRGFWYCMMVLCVLFAYRGLISGLVETVRLILKQHGASMQEQSVMTIPNYPWTLKIFIAAFFDAFFVKQIGKCKTYILICGIGKFLILFLISFNIDSMVKDLEIGTIAGCYFGLNVFSALESVSVDAWVLTLLSEQDLPKGALPDSIGQTLGMFLTYSIFGSLSSTNFINKWIFTSNPLKEPIMDLRESHQIVAWFGLITMVLIMFTVAEKNIKRASFWDVVKLLPRFVTNGPIRGFIGFIMLKYMGQNLFGAVISFELIERGFSYDYLIIIGTLQTPISIAIVIFAGRWLIRGQNQKMSILFSIISFMSSITSYVLVANYHGPKDDNKMFLWLLVTSAIFSFGSLSYIFDVGFLNDIADVKIGGLYITFMACFMNLSGMLPETVGLWVIKYTNFDMYSYITLTISLISIPLAWWYAKKLDSLDVTAFKVMDDEDEAQEGRMTNQGEEARSEPEQGVEDLPISEPHTDDYVL